MFTQPSPAGVMQVFPQLLECLITQILVAEQVNGWVAATADKGTLGQTAQGTWCMHAMPTAKHAEEWYSMCLYLW